MVLNMVPFWDMCSKLKKMCENVLRDRCRSLTRSIPYIYIYIYKHTHTPTHNKIKQRGRSLQFFLFFILNDKGKGKRTNKVTESIQIKD